MDGLKQATRASVAPAVQPCCQQIVMNSFQQVRGLGASVDSDGILLLASNTVSRTRTTNTEVKKSWVKSFVRRHKLASLRVTSSRPPSSPLEIQNDNRWRRIYEEMVMEPERFGMPGPGPIPLEMQFAADETPALYSAPSPKTLAQRHSNPQGEEKQVRVKAGDRRTINNNSHCCC